MSQITEVLHTEAVDQPSKKEEVRITTTQLEKCPFIEPNRTVVQLRPAEEIPIEIWSCMGAVEHNRRWRFCASNCAFYRTIFTRSKNTE